MQWQQAIVRVWDGLPNKGGRFVGTAFFIDAQTLLTAKHVTANCPQGVYLDGTPGGGKEKIEPDNIYPSERDIAVLKTSRPFSDIVPLQLSIRQLCLRQQVRLAGFFDETQALHTFPAEISGHVSNIHTWRTQGNLSQGMSGGLVLFAESDELAGIIQARDADKNLNYFIPADVIRTCLPLQDSIPQARLYSVPSLPGHYFERNEHLEKIIELLLHDSGHNVGITGISRSIGLQGMGGIGKSILAAAVANDKRIRTAFLDGVVWITFGQTPDIVSLQSQAAGHLNEEEIIPENPQQGRRLLTQTLGEQKILLILDDVWNIDHLQYFNITTEASRILITTRQAQIISESAGAEEYKIDILSEDQSLQLLRKQINLQEDVLPDEALLIVRECGCLPLALSMVGAMLRRPPHRWQRVLRLLQDAELKKIRQKFINYPYPDLFKALHVSVEALPPLLQQRYLELAIFPEDVHVPESVLEIYWDEEKPQEYDAIEVIDNLVDASLLSYHDNESRTLALHDLQRDYLQKQCADLPQCHAKLIAAYAQTYPDGWHTIPYEKPWYFHNHCIFHFQQGGNDQQAKELADELLNNQPFLNWNNALACAELLDKTPEQIAPQLIKTNVYQSTLLNCLKILGNKAKEDARRLIREHQNQNVLRACLNLLGDEAKEDARRLIREHQGEHVIIACINLLGEEAKEAARRLIREHQGEHVLTACLNMLGDEAKEDARRLIREHQGENLLTACLNMLGDEAKEAARRLIREHQGEHVLTACLNMLGDEAKEDARRLIREHKAPEVITGCLNLLGEEAKEDARLLLREHKDHRVLMACLKLLGKDAKEDARRLIRKKNQARLVINTCLRLLSKEEAKEDARCLLREHQDEQVLITSLNLLGEDAKDDARRLLKSKSRNENMLMACIRILGKEAEAEAKHLIKNTNNRFIRETCRELMCSWETSLGSKFPQLANLKKDL